VQIGQGAGKGAQMEGAARVDLGAPEGTEDLHKNWYFSQNRTFLRNSPIWGRGARLLRHQNQSLIFLKNAKKQHREPLHFSTG
jgi:hypothetical protein